MERKSKISAESLFHFTNSSERLLEILENTFSPRYCMEDYSTLESDYKNKKQPDFSLPMTCFCDIPLSEISDHSENYGEYAIGLTKEWGIKNKINPILYTIPNTALSETLRTLVDMSLDDVIEYIGTPEFKQGDQTQTPQYTHISAITYLGTFTKQYKGKQFKYGKYLNDDIVFYNEKEWRYVPDVKKLAELNIPICFKGPDMLSLELKNLNNNKLKENFKLNFEPSDIRYIIVKSDSEIIPLFDKIMHIKAKYSPDERKLLATRIISMENIKKDF